MNLFDSNLDFATLSASSQQWLMLIRLGISLVCGSLIGLERTLRYKEAGIRTHAIVCCSSAALMMLSKYGFIDIANNIDALGVGRGADAARIAAAILSGIGFLCAAVIFKQGKSVHGLTTAAGIWAVAAIGMLIGAGMYILGGVLTALILLILYFLHLFKIGQDAFVFKKILVVYDIGHKTRKAVTDFVESHGGGIDDVSLTREHEGKAELRLTVHVAKEFTYEEVTKFLDDNPQVHSMSIDS